MEGIHSLEHLELLELYDNMIDELRELGVRPGDETVVGAEAVGEKVGQPAEIISKGTCGLLPRTKLQVLDISYNVIRDMDPVGLCPNLQELCEFLFHVSYHLLLTGPSQHISFLLSLTFSTQTFFIWCRYCTKQNKKHQGTEASQATS